MVYHKADDFYYISASKIAYKTVYGHTAATYEICDMSAFKHGRLELIRPATAATNHAYDLLSKNASEQDLLAALSKCSSLHVELIKNVATGKWTAIDSCNNLQSELDFYLDVFKRSRLGHAPFCPE